MFYNNIARHIEIQKTARFFSFFTAEVLEGYKAALHSQRFVLALHSYLG